MQDLSNKVAVITGASSGIGMAVAKTLSQAGCRLLLVARREGRLQALQRELATKAAVWVGDVSDTNAATAIEQAAVDTFGRVDILVNNAGMLSIRPLERIDLALASQVLAVNLEAVIRLSYTFAVRFKAQGAGAIINVSSIGAFMTVPMAGVYAASKAGVESFTAALRVELGGSGVKVGTIVPGSTESEILTAASANGDQPWQQSIDFLQADDVASAVMFMLMQPPQANIAKLHIYAAEEIS